MLTEKGNIVINQQAELSGEDYEWLRKTGLSYIQQFSGKLWTDYNIHDPGITILELLCYALTDLSYRCSLPVADLLTAEGEKSPNSNDFYTARKILTSHPLTIEDYRKLILDRVPGIRNVWIDTLDETFYNPALYFNKKTIAVTLEKPPVKHPFEVLKLKGLYEVKLEAEDYQSILNKDPQTLKTLAQYRDKDSVITSPQAKELEYEKCLENYTKKLLADSRNICEDFQIVTVAQEEWVAICADIELKPEANADEVFLELYKLLYNYISPSIKFYSFRELIEKGKRTEEIFDGPAATRGFIDENDLKTHGHKETLYVSDIINLLMDIKGKNIIQIKSIHLSSYKQETDGTYTIIEDAQQYCLHLKNKTNAVFQFILDAEEQDKKKILNHIRFSKGPIYFSPKRKPEYVALKLNDNLQFPPNFQNDLPIPSGRNRNLLNYFSVQNDFPLCYYTGMEGIPNGETKLRKSQRLQTKAFLLFFDQLLANYLAQLNNLKNIFTFRSGTASSTVQSFPLNQNIIKDLRKLLLSNLKENAAVTDKVFFDTVYKAYNGIIETAVENKTRRNKLLDHLLARFNELFVDYTVFKFQQNKEGDFFDESITDETIEDKIEFLKLYPIISGKRSHAFNYTQGVYAIDNTSGLQLRLQKMMGLASSQNLPLITPVNNIDYQVFLQNIATKKVPAPEEKLVVPDNRFSSFDSAFGFHILEHILLRPLYKQTTLPISKLLPLCGDGNNKEHLECITPDHFSMQLTVVLPGWLAISSSMDFRAFTENLIRTEAPAHVALKICWIDPSLMFLFEKTTEAFFNEMAKMNAVGAKPSKADIERFNKALQDVYTMMGLLKNIYPPSKLNECGDINYNEEIDQMKTPVILNHSALGSSGDEEWYIFQSP